MNNNNGLWLQLVGTGLIADRPNIPTPPPGVGCFWIATDTGNISAWNGSAWSNIGSTTAGGGASGSLGVAFAALPAAPFVGQTAFVTDLAATALGGNAAGGGALKASVAWDGTHWKVGGGATLT